jgi:N12 class adenine-specific DNA methylase
MPEPPHTTVPETEKKVLRFDRDFEEIKPKFDAYLIQHPGKPFEEIEAEFIVPAVDNAVRVAVKKLNTIKDPAVRQQETQKVEERIQNIAGALSGYGRQSAGLAWKVAQRDHYKTLLKNYRIDRDNPYHDRMEQLKRFQTEAANKTFGAHKVYHPPPLIGLEQAQEYESIIQTLNAQIDHAIKTEAESLRGVITPVREQLDKEWAAYRTGRKKTRKTGGFGYAYAQGFSQVDDELREIRHNPQRQDLDRRENALKIAEKYLHQIEQAGDLSAGGWGAFWQGISQQDRVDFATLGMKNLVENFNILSYAKKLERGEALTTEEQTALELYQHFQALASAKEIPWQYQAGQSLVQSIPFMIDIALTGGLRSGITKGTAKVAEKYVKNKLGQWALKSAGKVLSPAASATVTPIGWQNFTGRELQSYEMGTDAQGKFSARRYDDAPSSAAHFFTGLAEGAISVAVEQLSLPMGKWGNKLVTKYPRNNTAKYLGALLGTSPQGNNIVTKTLNKIRHNTLVGGFFPELGEEYVEKVAGLLFLPDTPQQQRTKAAVNNDRLQLGLPPLTWKEEFTVEEFLATATSVGIMTGFFGMAKIPHYIRNRTALNRLHSAGEQLSPDLRKKIDDAMDFDDPQQRKSALQRAGVLQAQTPEGKKAIFEYLARRVEYDFAHAARQASEEEQAIAHADRLLHHLSHESGSILEAVDSGGNTYLILKGDSKDPHGLLIGRNIQTGALQQLSPQEVRITEIPAEQFKQDLTGQLLQSYQAPETPSPEDKVHPAGKDNDRAFTGEKVILHGETYTIDGPQDENGNFALLKYNEEGLPETITVPAEQVRAAIQQQAAGVAANGAPESAKKAVTQIPKDEKGHLRYEEVAPELTVQALTEQADNDKDFAAGVAAAAFKKAQEEAGKLMTAGGQQLYTGDPNKDLANRERIKILQDRLAYWAKVKQLFAGQQTITPAATFQAQQRKEQAEATRKTAEAGFPAIVAKWQKAPKIEGFPQEIILPDGGKMTGRYILTEAGAPTPSHNPAAGFAKSEGFPVDKNGRTVNDRDYEHDKQAQQLVLLRAGAYDSRAVINPVVVSHDGIVLSGNDRTMSGQLAAQNNTDKAYLDYLYKYAGNYGFNEGQLKQFAHPRIVFVPDASLPYTTATFAKFNTQETKTQNKTEQAVKAGKTISEATINKLAAIIDGYESLAEFYTDTAAVNIVLQTLVADGVIGAHEVAELKDEEALSPVGKDFLENIITGAVLEEKAIRQIHRMKDIRLSVVSALAQLLTNRRLGADYNLTNETTDAIHILYDARKQGIKRGENVREYLLQTNLWEGNPVAEATVQMLSNTMNHTKSGAFKKVLTIYNREAGAAAGGQVNMFAGKVRTKQELLIDILTRLGYDVKTENTGTVPAPQDAGQQNKEVETPLATGHPQLPAQNTVSPPLPGKVETPATTAAEDTATHNRQEPPSAPPAYGQSNTIISTGRYEELQEQLRQKLHQLNSGFDPEIFALGVQMALYHIEAGARKFADFAARMLAGLGEAVRPYLPSFYEGAKHLPGMQQYVSGMDDTGTIQQWMAATAPAIPASVPETAGSDQAPALSGTKENSIFAEKETISGTAGSVPLTSLFEHTNPTENNHETLSNPLRQSPDHMDAPASPGRTLFDVLPTHAQELPERHRPPGHLAGDAVDGPGAVAERGGRNSHPPDSATVRPGRDGRTGTEPSAIEPRPAGGDRSVLEHRPLLNLNTNNFRIERPGAIVPSGETAKIIANIQAIATLKTIERENQPATPGEKEILSRYSGWGGLAEVLNKHREDEPAWERKYGRFHRQIVGAKDVLPLLTPEEYTGALQSTLNAHYTSGDVVAALWQLAQRLGFKGGNVLEPAVGTGNFFGLMPPHLSRQSVLRAYELDSLTGRIATLLYPDAAIKVAGYEQSADRNMDLIITNVPFGQAAPYDKVHKDLSAFSLHNYFIAKGIRQLAPKGIGVFITSASTMDSGASAAFRQWVTTEGQADFIGAVRLPNNAFTQNAGTEVTTDILVFQKRYNGIPSPHAQSFRYAVPVKDTVKQDGTPVQITVNEYFAAHPRNMLGDLSLAYQAGSGGLYSGDNVTLVAPGNQNLAEALNTIMETFPKDITGSDNSIAVLPAESGEKEGTIIEKDGLIYEVTGGQLQRPDWASGTVNNKRQRKITRERIAKQYLQIKTIAGQLLEAERRGLDTIESLRVGLNSAYNAFYHDYGYFNNNLKLQFLVEADVEYNMVFALEKVVKRRTIDAKGNTRQTVQVAKADIFTKRILFPVQEPQSATNIPDALYISIAYRGRLDVLYLSKLLRQPAEDVQDALLNEGWAFINPATGQLEDRDTYLSGKVRTKHKQAVAAAENHPGFKANVEALQAVVPKTIPATQVKLRLGSPFIPGRFIENFVRDFFKMDARITYQAKIEHWVVTVQSGSWSAENQTQYGAPEFTAIELLEKGLNLKQPEVFDTVRDADGKKQRIKNIEKTAAAQAALHTIVDAFVNYIYANNEAMADIETLYNDIYNDYIEKNYSVPPLQHYPDAATGIELRRHQKRAVARGLQDSLLLAHQVGTGKTYTLQTIAMEMRRLHIAKKPMIVVQNATMEQFVASFKQLYPAANILAPTKKMMDAKNRQRLFSLIAYGDFDAIIIPQSFVDKIPDSVERQRAYIREQMDELEWVLLGLDEDDHHGLSGELRKTLQTLKEELDNIDKPKVKDIAKRQLNLTKRLHQQSDRRTDQVLTFEQMGIDALLVDEAHAYKKLGFFTKMNRIKGIDTGRSKRAFGMYMKTRFIQERTGGKNVIFATGTPITNTMAEVWTMMKYLSPDILDSYKINSFDEFAATFGNVEPSLEFTATGSFKIVERFKSYINAPELLTAFRAKTDVVLTEDIPEFKDNPTIPQLKNGEYTKVVIPQSAGLEAVMDELRGELEAWELLSGKEKRAQRHVPLVVFNKAKQAAIDLRLLHPANADDAESKTNRVVREVKRIYDETLSFRGTQLIFSDMYQSPENLPGNRFNLYEDMKAKLIRAGIAPQEIAIIHHYEGAKRDELFEQVNKGAIRVVLGSTERMGVGVNLQERLAALHHMDAPPRPMDFEQRNGRILRQGNLLPTLGVPVEILTYGVEKTLDATAYQRLAIKQKFINQMMKGENLGREIADHAEEDSPSDMTFDQMMSTLSGSQYAVLHVQKSYELKKLETAERNFRRRQIEINQQLKDETNNIIYRKNVRQKLHEVNQALAGYFPTGKITAVTVNGQTHTEKMGEALDHSLRPYIKDYAKHTSGEGMVIPLSVRINSYPENVQLELRDMISHEFTYTFDMQGYTFSGTIHSGQGLLTSLHSRFAGIEDEIERNRETIVRAEQRLPILQEELKKPFDKNDKLEALRREVKELEEKMKAETIGAEQSLSGLPVEEVGDDNREKEQDKMPQLSSQVRSGLFTPLASSSFFALLARLKKTGLAAGVVTGKAAFDAKLKAIREKDQVARQQLSEMESIKQRAIRDGVFMRAPNGKKTNLSETQWLQVRTTNFKNWFGDWENTEPYAGDSSVVLDGNGEPRVMYHGAKALFTIFDFTKGQRTDAGWLGEGFYFYENATDAAQYERAEGRVMRVFLNIRNPYFATIADFEKLADANDPAASKAFSDGLKEQGYDGVYFNGNLMGETVAFNPTQIKAAIDNAGTFDANNPDIYFQVASSTGFYSTVEKALQAITQDKGTPAQFKAMLLHHGAKQAELDWMGWDVVFATAERITKQDIQDWMDAHKITVREIEKQENNTLLDPDYYRILDLEINDTADYPEGYEVCATERGFEIYRNGREQVILENPGEVYDYLKEKGIGVAETKYTTYQLPGGKNYKELLLLLPTPHDPHYETSHWDEQDVLAHVRFNERTDTNGQKVLFIEEIQSDWAQEGKKKGFKSAIVWKKTDRRYTEFLLQMNKKYGGEWKQRMTGQERQEEETLRQEREKAATADIPDMPFRHTGQWVQLVLRRMMRYAVENGFDRIAWTTGEQQAQRYGLSQAVSEIHYQQTTGEQYAVHIIGDSGETLIRGQFAVKELEPIVGKEITRQILEGGASGVIKGDHLTVGSKGMNVFYDTMLPSFAGKLGKPFHAAVEKTTIARAGTVYSLPVTGEMRRTIAEQGVPLFMRTPQNETYGFVTAEGVVYIDETKMNANTPVHEFAHLWLQCIKKNNPGIYRRGADLIKHSRYWDAVTHHAAYAHLSDEAKTDEALATAIGDKGEAVIHGKGLGKALAAWIHKVWERLGVLMGIRDLSTEQLRRLTLEQFTNGAVADLLNGKRINPPQKKAQQAQDYYTLHPDRLPLTLSIFNREDFKAWRGKNIKPATLQQLLRQSGIKQIEKQLVNDVIDAHYPSGQLIPYDEMEAMVRANILPLQRITTNSYASYGRENLGNETIYGDGRTIIFNAPVEHGRIGHFYSDYSDFNTTEHKDSRYIPQQLNPTTWAAIETNREAGAGKDAGYLSIGITGSKEAVDTWIAQQHNRPAPQQGLFGHLRVWQNGTVFYLAELQSDFFQKNNARKILIEATDAFKDFHDAIAAGQKSVNDHYFDRLAEIRQKETDELLAYIDNSKDIAIRVEPAYEEKNYKYHVKLYVNGIVAVTNKTPYAKGSADLHRKDFLSDLYKDYYPAHFVAFKKSVAAGTKKSIMEITAEKQQKEQVLEQAIRQKYEEIYSTLPSYQKQFIASQKEWEKRLLREALKEAAMNDATVFRLPTPYTLSLMEGYISNSGGLPYEIVKGNSHTLDTGDIIALGERYVVAEVYHWGDDVFRAAMLSGSDEINPDEYIVQQAGAILRDITEKAPVYFKDRQAITREEVENISDDAAGEPVDIKKAFFALFDRLEEGAILSLTGNETALKETIKSLLEETIQEDVKGYFEGRLGYALAVEADNKIYLWKEAPYHEIFKQPSEYMHSYGKEDFSIAALDDTQQTVVKKYEELAVLFLQERGANNVTVVEDENGMEWYETTLFPAEKHQPVVAFQTVEHKRLERLANLLEIDINDMARNEPKTTPAKTIQGKTKIQKAATTAVEKFADKYQRVKNTLLEVEKRTGEKIAIAGHPYYRLDKLSARSKAAMENFYNRTFHPLLEKITLLADKLPGEWPDDLIILHKEVAKESKFVQLFLNKPDIRRVFDFYLIAKHAPFRNAYIAGKTKGEIQEGSGITEAEAAAVVAVFEHYFTGEEITDFWKAVEKATDISLFAWVDTGRITQRDANELKQKLPFFVPLRNWDETESDKAVDAVYWGNGSDTYSAYKQAQGRSTIAESPLTYIANLAQSAIAFKEKNDAKRMLFNIAVKAKQYDLLRPRKIYLIETLDRFGNVIATREVGTKPEAGTLAPNENIVEKIVSGRRIMAPYLAQQHETTVWIDGQKYIMEFADEQVAQEINQNIHPLSQALISTVGKVTRFMASMMTQKNPSFILKNTLRDAQHALSWIWVYEGNAMAVKFMKHLPMAAKTTAIMQFSRKQELPTASNKRLQNYIDYYEAYRNAGSRVGFTQSLSIEQLKKDIDRAIKQAGEVHAGNFIKKSARLLNGVAAISEDISRFAAFCAARESGKNVAEASHIAKEVSVNFNQVGSYSKIPGAFYAFFNANVQAVANHYGMFKTDPFKATIIAAMHVALGALNYSVVSAFLTTAGGDDDKLKNLSNYRKYVNIFIPADDEGFVQLPLSQTWRPFWAMGVALAQVWNGELTSGEALKGVAEQVGSWSPIDFGGNAVEGFVPTAIKPLYETFWKEENFMGTPLKSRIYDKKTEENTPNYLRGVRTNQPALWQKAVEAMVTGDKATGTKQYNEAGTGLPAALGGVDISPDQLQHLVLNYTGGVGTFFNDLCNLTANLVTGGDVTPNKVPLVSSFYSHAKPGYYANRYYRLKNLFDQFENNLQMDKQTGRILEYVHAPELQKMLTGVLPAMKTGEKYIDMEREEALKKIKKLWDSQAKQMHALSVAGLIGAKDKEQVRKDVERIAKETVQKVEPVFRQLGLKY